jgi:hypothetical protein
MSSNGGTHRRTSVEDNKAEDIGPYLSQIKSSGGMTISPELFEKVSSDLKRYINGSISNTWPRSYISPPKQSKLEILENASRIRPHWVSWGERIGLTSVCKIDQRIQFRDFRADIFRDLDGVGRGNNANWSCVSVSFIPSMNES